MCMRVCLLMLHSQSLAQHLTAHMMGGAIIVSGQSIIHNPLLKHVLSFYGHSGIYPKSLTFHRTAMYIATGVSFSYGAHDTYIAMTASPLVSSCTLGANTYSSQCQRHYSTQRICPLRYACYRAGSLRRKVSASSDNPPDAIVHANADDHTCSSEAIMGLGFHTMPGSSGQPSYFDRLVLENTLTALDGGLNEMSFFHGRAASGTTRLSELYIGMFTRLSVPTQVDEVSRR